MNTRLPFQHLLLMGLMLFAAAVASALTPTVILADQRPKLDLEELVPRQFGEWRELPQSSAQIVNPQAAELLRKLYSQTLSRTYINSQGGIVMLSIAYGANQSDAVQLHYPEVCYPAQGFQLRANVKDTLETPHGVIPVKRLLATLGNRSEPITYWATLGDRAVYGGMETKLAQLQYGFKGQIPDGLLFRVSSITREIDAGYILHDHFVKEFVSALPSVNRARLTGLSS